MPGQLRTIPLAIAAVGMTVDGREITDKDIDDIVETYNYKKYGARINIDHSGEWSGWEAKHLYNIDLNGGMLGDVLEVTTGVNDEGIKVLYAVLAPNASFVTLNQADQAVYFSIEIDRDFIKSGATYLTGLAVTDYPASTYTERAKFNQSSKGLESFQVQLTKVELTQERLPKRNLFKGLFKKEEPEMKKEDFASALTEALSEPLKQMNEAITGNTQALAALTISGTKGGGNDEGGADDTTPPEAALFSKEQQAAFDKINSSVTALSTQLTKALKTPQFGTTPGEEEHLGDEGELGDLL
ncbi:GPO family capsid scaffolding protein [Shewanella surugensis]|uniref:GPO family capsid scaffolding protein n=1 Tax=Shewanella surugensis TaxID=212020 RepID=A0ABT0L6K5_9GAMM|nr:GPO family capsid scaffolding protein [Shewanella surugensis]MCL1123311.1 GPO family capsid scaffolding protein [Shewanella surugensis]